ncbi:RNA 2',3'-cyclic phosphodiesterase [Niallia alba]|uniref:RNA 2',3'-cyclic phosphodiesterase n=1 Tax=Niallia alba TaxID=2729105 RepID=UPI0028FF4CE3|nr:RNA 2',3'-cyclic phosphodiesterase [Niallia nealsonii]MED3790842.1 RNA 2',3'-cyclic phosphodiesterase [Niallia alba]
MKNAIPHYFIGIKPDVQVMNELEKMSKELQQKFSFKKWVHPLDYHITLAFLGSASKDKRDKLQTLLKQSVLASDEFPLHIEQLGVFGQFQSPRIFWAGMKEEKKLFDLRKQVFEICMQADFQLETRPFHPHLTLARKWDQNTMFLEQMLKEYSLPKDLIFMVESIHLFQTHIEKIPKYEIIESYSFKD